jgi:predicted lipoprotein with Yx(FWY)xxD motif
MPRAHFAALLAAALAPSALSAQEPFFSVAQDDAVGSYLVGPGGRPVYIFDTSARGGDFLPPLESCGPRCREAWPPVFVSPDTNLVVPDALDPELTGMVPDDERIGTASDQDDPRMVASYGGEPLFYYAREDEGPGPSGHGIHTHGGWWIALAPDGAPIITGSIPDSGDR